MMNHCDCGAWILPHTTDRHFHTRKHQTYLFKQYQRSNEPLRHQRQWEEPCECGGWYVRTEHDMHCFTRRHRRYTRLLALAERQGRDTDFVKEWKERLDHIRQQQVLAAKQLFDKGMCLVNKQMPSSKEVRNAPITCECGAVYQRQNKAHHMRSSQHLRFLNQEPSIQCDCGGSYTLNHKSDHEATARHQNHLKGVPNLYACEYCGVSVRQHNQEKHLRSKKHTRLMKRFPIYEGGTSGGEEEEEGDFLV